MLTTTPEPCGQNQVAIPSTEPKQLILQLYDLGIAGCHDGDDGKVRRVLTELTAALNFDCGEIAHSFHSMYQFSFKMLNEERFDQVLDILSGLRSAWRQMINATEGISQNTNPEEFNNGN